MVTCSASNCTNYSNKKLPGVTFHRFPKNPAMLKLWLDAIGREHWVPTSYSRLCSNHFEERHMDRTSKSSTRLREFAVPSIFIAKEVDVVIPKLEEVDVPSFEEIYIPSLEEFVPPNDINTISHIENQTANENPCHTNAFLPPNVTKVIPHMENRAGDENPCNTNKFLPPNDIKPIPHMENQTADENPCNTNEFLPGSQSDTSAAMILGLKRRIRDLSLICSSQRKRIRILQQNKRRNDTKITSLTATIIELKSKQLISDIQ